MLTGLKAGEHVFTGPEDYLLNVHEDLIGQGVTAKFVDVMKCPNCDQETLVLEDGQEECGQCGYKRGGR
jgi:hypothetical protein